MQGSRPLSVALRFVMACAMALLVVGISTVPAADRPSSGQGKVASITNGLLRVTVDRQDGKLLGLEDLAAKHNHVGETENPSGLWKLELIADGQRLTLKSEQARTFQCEALPAGQRGLRLTWSDFTPAGTAECQVEATVRLDDGQSTSRWEIALEKPSGLGLHKVHFPRVSGLTRQTDERLAVPIWMGQQLADPRALLRGSDGRGRRLAWDYPGRLSMQCLAYYGNGGCGFDAACDDTAAMRKTFSLWGTSGGDVHFEMVHYPVGQAIEADQYRLPYRVSLGAFRGDWITAAERYRAWAENQEWVRQSRLRQGLVPEWVLETGLWVWNRGRSPGVLPPAAALQQRLGLPVSVFWHWWHGCPYDIGFPEYLPPREGTEPFRQARSRCDADRPGRRGMWRGLAASLGPDAGAAGEQGTVLGDQRPVGSDSFLSSRLSSVRRDLWKLLFADDATLRRPVAGRIRTHRAPGSAGPQVLAAVLPGTGQDFCLGPAADVGQFPSVAVGTATGGDRVCHAVGPCAQPRGQVSLAWSVLATA